MIIAATGVGKKFHNPIFSENPASITSLVKLPATSVAVSIRVVVAKREAAASWA
jgi:hypothetical protein